MDARSRFSSKWGVREEDLNTHTTYVIIMTHFVVIAAVLCLLRPKFVLSKSSTLRVPEISVLRVVCVAAMVAGLTYLYPLLIA